MGSSKLALLVCGLLIAGCASTAFSPVVSVAIPSAKGAQWPMEVKSIIPQFGPPTISLLIDQQVVGTSTGRGPVKIEGTYEGHPIQSLCTIIYGDASRQGTCTVYVDGTLVASIPAF